MKRRVGILTSGGDCPGLNATLRGVAKALYERMGDDVEIIGILNGYQGLIDGDWRVMEPREFSGILTVGGTILGLSLIHILHRGQDRHRRHCGHPGRADLRLRG